MSFAQSTTNDFLTGRKPTIFPAGAELIAQRFSLPLATADLALNTIGNIGILPAGRVPVELLVDSDDLDSNGTPTIVWSVGVSNAAVSNNAQGLVPTAISTLTADGGAAWATGLTVSQNGGQVQAFSKALARVQPVNYDRYIVLQATAAAATAVAGEIGVTLVYRPN